ncbi:RNA guanine-N7 methyltransferase activating subunit isoform X3 [Helicoverpa zea]|uniref:RNA guanine-N7 methyltransferase activating subunit isoform X3 n=1 Tax=Helicoverpa zea TaxID=7113 RepID=UPI001F568705|nr:RNA guanine-N7 methyltransferase activating subunit isoform X3 [Helicoverpa zea]XP_047039420.1 RNA guanine-N7 methyltransferase activating subunit isoform X3 [Helicoverpa zea]XP_047039428.1 RNA guanine-N7 methyltransferase activating subunit isoform X3 [Helicoverpa zea]XP_047039435.1 RNA guanine-N7 methyltransferase activating subunit isoform X3 [Helicoverpa zea]XP_047039440.1 RNA guanine-N7 methyltransferase activating subunit isoform X3 [Helicoverpa zea]XP_047039447.1 RNA guanine-N7 methy
MADTLSAEDKEFLAKCEEELKDRFTEKDEDFMKVFNEVVSKPPVVDSWWVPNSGRRNDRRNNRRNHPYQRDNRDRNYDRRDNRGYNDYNRGYNDYNRGYDDSGSGYRARQRYPY